MQHIFRTLQLKIYHGIRAIIPKQLLVKVMYWVIPNVLAFGKFKGKFFNLGYFDDNGLEVSLEDHDEKYQMFFYHYLSQSLQINNKRILEIGSGRGGGLYYLAKYHQPKQLIGIDLSSQHIAFCKSLKIPKATFIQGRAESFELPNTSVDLIFNLESSKCYNPFSTFLKKAYDVLEKNGYLVLCDFRPLNQIDLWEKEMQQIGFHIQFKETVNEKVIKAIESQELYKKEKIINNNFLSKLISTNFLGMIGSPIHKKLKNNEVLYNKYLLKKVGL